MHKKLIIIGGGPAGLSAACAAVDRGLSASDILVLERDSEPGGILNQCIHAGFGLHRFGEELSGPEYAGRYIKMARERNIEILTYSMVLSLTDDRCVTFVSPALGYTKASADAVILAMGCRERTRGALNIPGSRPAGIYTAGCAQRYVNIEGFMPGHRVVILGSGDIGLIMARRMTLEGAKVLAVCEIMPYSGGLARNIAQCLDDFDIPLMLSHTVTRIHGKERVQGVTIAQVDENNGRRPIPETEQYIECDTLLLSVGLIPENELTRGANIALDRMTSGAAVNQYRETSAEGIYAAGNVLHVHDLVDYVSEEAEIAGYAAADRILGKSKESKKTVDIHTGFGVRYTVPERIDLSRDSEPLKIFFRSDNVYKKVQLIAETESGKILAKRTKTAVAPGEMESLEIKSDDILDLIGTDDKFIRVYIKEFGGDAK
ncbi:MAG: pyridine nucleotide-disulfide oxidoreductase [Ruminococcaceae bacterium]|nr:pyridine nucleotide-disulfide oxidoreductase [Oscillospiraceae bacterium]